MMMPSKRLFAVAVIAAVGVGLGAVMLSSTTRSTPPVMATSSSAGAPEAPALEAPDVAGGVATAPMPSVAPATMVRELADGRRAYRVVIDQQERELVVESSHDGFRALGDANCAELWFAILADRDADDELRNEAMNLLRGTRTEELAERLVALASTATETSRMRSFAVQNLSLSLAYLQADSRLLAQRKADIHGLYARADVPDEARRDCLLAMSQWEEMRDLVEVEVRRYLETSSDRGWLHLSLRLADELDLHNLRELVARHQDSADRLVAGDAMRTCKKWNDTRPF